MLRLKSWSLALAGALAITGCSGGKPPAARTDPGVAKGVPNQFYFVNLFTPPIGGTITSSIGGINCGASSLGTPVADAQGVLQYAPSYYAGSNRCGTNTANTQTSFLWSQTVVLTANAVSPNVFIGWAGSCSGAGTCTLSPGADKSVVAIFGPPGSGHQMPFPSTIHGPSYLASVRPGATFVCTTCHGPALAGQSIAPSCTPCHAAAGHPGWQSDCTFCHGAPPPRYVGATPDPAHPTVSSDVTTCTGCHPTTVNASGAIIAGGTHMDGQIQAQGGGHAAGFASASVHGPQYLDHVGGVSGAMDCTSCHGAALTSCNACHSSVGSGGWANWQSNCTFCHGTRTATYTGADLARAAPPDAVSQRLSSAAAPDRTGAHAVHLTSSAFALGFNCGICHAVPSDTSHIGGSTARATVTLAQSGQASLPPLGTYTPPGSGSSVGGTCATYCHGSNPSPAWDFVGLQCGSCHATPPATSSHSTVTPNDLSACVGCHPATMNTTGGTVDVAGGHHVNGLVEFSGGHPAGWLASTVHGYSANQQGLQACTTCHTGFGPVGGAAGTSCNDCHASNGHASWQTDCTFCHGTAGRAFNQAGPFPGRLVPTLAELAASPPVGPQGQLASTEAMVGAHLKHVNPPAAGARSIPIACSDCHATPLPTGIAHVDGLRAPLPFGGIAVTGSITDASFNPGTLTCSNTYCHGNFPQGTSNARSSNTPSWTGAALSCTGCHTLRPWGHTSHQSTDNGCADCHEGYSASTVNVTLHVNGVKNVGGPATSLGSAFSIDQFGVKTCSNVSCHGWGGPDGW